MGHYDHSVDGIIFNEVNYDNKSDLFNDIRDTLRILTDNGNVCTFYYEGEGLYIIQHAEDEEWAEKTIVWVNKYEYDEFLSRNKLNEKEDLDEV